ncbi:pyruvate kinase [Klebsiella pneumoniae]|uniref:pyruvate kinase n=1 Tax=Klebsiella pneumoniae TaxID=573 RepID=A0A4P0Y9D0_KLEPN|nr:pyruvate kinase [Klebsiella pneumoniae]
MHHRSENESEEMLTKMLEAGMNVMRLNFSHGDYAEHGQRIQNLRNVMSKTGKKAAILLDTKGRKFVPSSWKAATTSP